MRSYEQVCGIARALDVLGGRWTLLILRDLLLGPTRYGALLLRLKGIPTNLLAERLADLESAGLVERSEDLHGSPAWALTAQGRMIEPVLMELGRFGAALPLAPGESPRGWLGWGLISMKRRYLGGVEMEVEVRGEETFTLSLSSDRLDPRHGPAVRPTLVIQGAAPALRAVLLGGADPKPWLAEGSLVVAGDSDQWGRFRAAFASPGA